MDTCAPLTQATMPPRASSGGKSCSDSSGRWMRHSTAPPSWCATTNRSLSPRPIAACNQRQGKGSGEGKWPRRRRGGSCGSAAAIGAVHQRAADGLMKSDSAPEGTSRPRKLCLGVRGG